MRILIAEDDSTTRLVLERTLAQWGHEVVSTKDGLQARAALEQDDAPQLAILDWMMPGMDGAEVCRWARSEGGLQQLYIIMLTMRDTRDDIVEGLKAGANDFVIKPPDLSELQARIDVGIRVVELQSKLADRVRELEESIAREKHLEGLLPICSYCKKIRDDDNYWKKVESYIQDRAEVSFSHGICPDCYETIVQPQLDSLDAKSESEPHQSQLGDPPLT